MGRWAVAFRLIGIGWYIIACLVIGLVGGIWLDRAVGGGVLFTIVGLFVGLVLGGLGVYQALLPLMREGRAGGESIHKGSYDENDEENDW